MKKLAILGIVVLIGGILAYNPLQAQQSVQGTVTSAEDGEALPGVTILVKGTSTGTVSDIDGTYGLDLPYADAVLVFTYIGYRAVEEAVGARTTIDVIMDAQALALEEVVVSGVGLNRERRSLSYAVEDVKSDEILNSQENHLTKALSGKVPGVVVQSNAGVPGAGAQIRIRGATSITRSNTPLYVIDGVPIDNSTNASTSDNDDSRSGVDNSNRAIDINPDDIESISVLKGGAGTALYGIRGANGVVLITTKKGSNSSSLKLSLNSSVSIAEQNGLTPTHDRWAQGGGSTQYVQPATGTIRSWGPPISELVWVNVEDNPALNPEDEDDMAAINHINAYERGRQVFFRRDAEAEDLPFTPVTPYDNIGDFYRTGSTYNNTLALSGGTKRSEYYVSAGYNTSTGVVPNSEFTRISSKGNFSYRFTPKLKVSTGLLYSNSKGTRIQRGSNTSGVNLALLRTPPTFDNSNGLGSDAPNNSRAYQLDDGDVRNYGFFDNPFWIVSNIPHNDETNRLISTFQVDYLFTSSFSLTYRLGNDYYVEEKTQGFTINSETEPSGNVWDDKTFSQDLNSDLILEYNREIIPQLSVNVIGGYNFYNATGRTTHIEGRDLSLPDFFDISNASTVIGADAEATIRRHGLYFDVGFDWRNMVFLNVTGRNDWSSTLPEEERSFFYPSVGGSFVFSELMGDNRIFSFGKIRASWAQIGNDAPAQSTFTPFVAATSGLSVAGGYSDGWTNGINFPAFGTSAFTESALVGNPAIKPETTTSIEVGTDLRFLNDRIGLAFTYFNYLTKDQVLFADIPTSTGSQNRLLNAGEVETSGVEVALDGVPFKSKTFTWEVGVTYYDYENTVNKLAPGLESVFLNGFTGTGSYVEVGQPYGVLRGGTWERDDQGRVIIGSDGYPVPSGRTEPMGDPNPDWTGALRNTFSYRNFTLSALVDARWGGEMWNGTKGALVNYGTSETTSRLRDKLVVYKGVVRTGGTDEEPIYETNTQEVPLTDSWFRGNGGGFGAVDEQFVEETTTVRLRSASLGYSLPKRYLRNVQFLSSASLTMSATNLFVWTKYDANEGQDPDISLTGGSNSTSGRNARGLNYFGFPNVRTYSLALRLGF